MLTRTISGIVLTIIAVSTIWFGGYVLAPVLALVSLTGYYELCKATKVHTPGQKMNLLEAVGYVGILAFYALLYFFENHTMLLFTIVFSLLIMMAVYVLTFPRFHADDLMKSGFALLYCPVMISFVYQTRQMEQGIYIVWLIFIASWISDTCAYLVGVTIGKHKYLPKLSPKKSIEGSIGGIVGAALVGGLYGYLVVEKVMPGQNITWIFALIGGVGSVISQIGDLVASAIKRNYEIKDYGRIIPGHGGIMDRFDSVIVTAPIIYCLAYYLIG